MPELGPHGTLGIASGRSFCPGLGFLICLTVSLTTAQAAMPAAKILTLEGRVQYQTAGTAVWEPAQTNQVLRVRDRLRTHECSGAVLQLADFSVLRVGELSIIEMMAPRVAEAKAKINFTQGLLYFLHRNDEGDLEIETPSAHAAIEGTEFNLRVDADGTTQLTMIDGTVMLSNPLGEVRLTSGEAGVVEPGRAPRKTAVLDLLNVIQWSLYYPGVLDPAEIGWSVAGEKALAQVMSAYREGDLLAAFNLWPLDHSPANADERLLKSALLLSVGRATNYDRLILPEDENHPLAVALRFAITAVRNEAITNPQPATNASQLVGWSYYSQSRHDLTGARRAAKQATELSPQFGFAWERLAELEFSHGRIKAAEQALDQAQALSPRNAQGHALRGFLWLARDKTVEATAAFEQAMQLDAGLGNAWLGRGLCRIQEGQARAGREDLQAAAVLEPNRWILRCYLAKAYSQEADGTRDSALRKELLQKARAELELAKTEAPNDPTPWLYSALLAHQQYESTPAIRDLERSVELNDNRQVFRSRLMLDQDRAVRGANLAQVYDLAHMPQVSLRESAKAAIYDYGNYSAHLNLAGSYFQLRDPTRFHLRHESEWFNEHLLASLLAPVGAGPLSQNLSQEEYSRVFSRKKFGLSSTTEYLSTGEIRELATYFGNLGGLSYAFDLDYQYKDGTRPNQELSRIEWYSRLKQKVSEKDSVMLITKYQDYESGDQFQHWSDTMARPDFRFKEEQMPWVAVGAHREWSPGVHTLALGGRFINDQWFSDLSAPQAVGFLFPTANPGQAPFDVRYQNRFEIYSGELNQIFQRERHTDILGVRYQSGNFYSSSTLDNVQPPAAAPLFNPPVATTGDGDFERLSVYEYHQWKLHDNLVAVGGVAYEQLVYPLNYRRPPLQNGRRRAEEICPKAALVWNPRAEVTLRGAYFRSLGGVSYDQSIRLEPVQFAGFSQSFRSLISETVMGSVEAPLYDVGGAALDLKFKTGTYLSLEGLWKRSEIERSYGYFELNAFRPPPDPAGLPAQSREDLDYREITGGLRLNQILAEGFFLDAQYDYTRSRLSRNLVDLPATPTYDRVSRQRSELHQLQAGLVYQHPSGLFARPEARWFFQDNEAGTGFGNSDFPMLNIFVGYRFPRHRGDLTLGVMNLTDEDYRLYPLNYYLEMPRERAFYIRLKINL